MENRLDPFASSSSSSRSPDEWPDEWPVEWPVDSTSPSAGESGEWTDLAELAASPEPRAAGPPNRPLAADKTEVPAVGTSGKPRQPGAGEPGAGEPGAGEPGAGEPGAGEPAAGEPGAVATAPDAPAAVAAGPSPWNRFLWLLCALAGLMAFTYLLPPFLERVQYSLTRGRQRAEYELSASRLSDSPLAELSAASQLVSMKVGPSVVHINLASLPRYEQIEGGGPPEPPSTGPRGPRYEGQGSGVIVDPEGYVVTNRHVVLGSREIQVKLGDGRVVPGRIVGVDRLTDLAVLKIDAQNLIPADWGDSGQLEVGAMVWALGSPFGLERSITFGILSAKHRADTTGNPYQDFLQTDAAVNPGNSGGPLVDSEGCVVGINTAIVGESYQGISFAIPSRVAREVYQRIRRQGRVRRGWLGVQPEPVTREVAQQMGIPELRGALIAALAEDPQGFSPAKTAGLRVGDVVIRWNDEPIDTPADLFSRVGMTEIGRAVDVVVIRDGTERTLAVVVSERRDP